jgi:hypothetical protein
MQHGKVIKNISEIENSFQNPDSLGNTFTRLLKEFNLNPINKILRQSKTKGVDTRYIFQVLFILPFINVLNIHTLMQSGFASDLNSKKDVYYSFLNNPQINWRKIITLFARQFTRICDKKSVDGNEVDDSPRCLLIDDSLVEKSGKKIEFIGKVFDHCSHTYKIGMKVLTLGFWDGKSFLPVDFSIHHEPGKKNNRGLKAKELSQQHRKQREVGTPGYQRAREVSESKIDKALEMIKSAVGNGFIPKYVLADSWFITDGFISQIQSIKKKFAEKIHVIGIMKSNRIVCIKGKNVKADLLPEIHKKAITQSRKLKCSYIVLTFDYKGTEVKGFFVKMNGQPTWKLLISTDTSLTFTKAMKYYQIRWTIEVFFKDVKQNLYFGKCQSNDFDAHIASLSICFMNYMLLSLEKRFDSYESVGQLFKAIKDMVLESTITEKLHQLFIDLYTSILAELGVDWEIFFSKLVESEFFLHNITKSFNFLFNFNQKIVYEEA